jgi:hypothetical protein
MTDLALDGEGRLQAKILEFALAGADIAHFRGYDAGNISGHTEASPSRCPHPDCVLVRSVPAAPPPQEGKPQELPKPDLGGIFRRAAARMKADREKSESTVAPPPQDISDLQRMADTAVHHFKRVQELEAELAALKSVAPPPQEQP